MIIILWLVFGVFLGSLLLFLSRSFQAKVEIRILSISLVVAAIVYIVFALVWGNSNWFFIELIGLMTYGLFVWLSLHHSTYWLAIGWLLHPLWDVCLHLLGPGNAIAPESYAIACISFDILIAAYVFYRTPYWKLEIINR